jgi:putative transposase
LEPTPAQEQVMLRFAGARRWVWNWALEQRKQHYAETGKALSVTHLCKRLTCFKHTEEGAWLTEIHSQLPQQAVRDLERAFVNFFERRAGFPRFKKKRTDRARFRLPQGIQLSNGCVVLPSIGAVRIRQSRKPMGTIKSATCKLDAAGHWFVTLVEHVPVQPIQGPLLDPARVVGLDRGLKDLIVASDGQRVAAPRWYRQSERNLKRASRAVSRAQRGSAGRQAAQRRLALVHQKVRNRRADSLHKLTTRLVHEYDGFCIETFSTKALARTKLAKSVLDASLGELERQLRYKAEWAGKPVVGIDRWYPSSKTCSGCGWQLDKLLLATRSWACPSCGVVQDRDLNAARNIRAEGLKLLAAGHADKQNARGAVVRPATGRRAA